MFLVIDCVTVYLGGGKSFNPMWNSTEQPIVLAVICALAGSYIAIWVCRIVPNIFSWIGKNTIPLLCVHFYPTTILQNYTDLKNWQIYIIVLCLSLPMTFLISRYIPVANGKSKLIK